MKNTQITTLTFFHFGAGAKWWMFTQMGRAISDLTEVDGLLFFRLMGSGAENGFSIRPDFSTYVLLGVWEDEEKASNFFQAHFKFLAFKDRSSTYWTVFLQNLKSHGKWAGNQPFTSVIETNPGIYAVLTRATIKPHQLVRFWRNVPGVSKDLENCEGMIYSKGIGEFPIFMQATISFWESKEDMVRFAYKSRLHSGAIAKTRTLGWYKEELFANFKPYMAEGNFEHPLSGFM